MIFILLSQQITSQAGRGSLNTAGFVYKCSRRLEIGFPNCIQLGNCCRKESEMMNHSNHRDPPVYIYAYCFYFARNPQRTKNFLTYVHRTQDPAWKFEFGSNFHRTPIYNSVEPAATKDIFILNFPIVAGNTRKSKAIDSMQEQTYFQKFQMNSPRCTTALLSKNMKTSS